MDYRLVKDYKHDNKLRLSFHDLTQKTFGFTLEDWYQNGYWGDEYIPYSLVDHDRVIANVSVNRMRFDIHGDTRYFIQLGTVMTDIAYRNLGLGRYLMQTVLCDYMDKSEDIYLYANDSVLDYYPKFNFKPSREYRYRKPVEIKSCCKVKKLDINKPRIRERLMDTLRSPAVNSMIHMDNFGLYLFWLTGPMRDQLYYCESEDAYLAASAIGDVLYLHQIISAHQVDMNQVIDSFGKDIHEVVLGFVPMDITGYHTEEYREDDCTLFVQGGISDIFEKQKLRFPELSHA